MSQNTLQNALLWTAGVAVLAGVTIGTITLRNAFPPVGIAPMSVSPCTVVICEEDPEPMEICWCPVKVTVTVTASESVIAVSRDQEEGNSDEEDSEEPNKYPTNVTVTVAVNGEPTFDQNFYDIDRIEWKLDDLKGLAMDAETAELLGQYLGQWRTTPINESFPMFGTSPDKATVKASVAVRYVFRKKACTCPGCAEEPSGNPSAVGEEVKDVPSTCDCPGCHSNNCTDSDCSGCGCSNFDYVNATVWVVGVDSIQYQHPTDGWKSGSPTVAKGATVNFRAIKNPIEAPSWPTGFPKWRHLTYTGLSSKDHGQTIDKEAPPCGCPDCDCVDFPDCDCCDCAEVGLELSGDETTTVQFDNLSARKIECRCEVVGCEECEECKGHGTRTAPDIITAICGGDKKTVNVFVGETVVGVEKIDDAAERLTNVVQKPGYFKIERKFRVGTEYVDWTDVVFELAEIQVGFEINEKYTNGKPLKILAVWGDDYSLVRVDEKLENESQETEQNITLTSTNYGNQETLYKTISGTVRIPANMILFISR